jgi:hypothetical protein
MPTYIKTGYWDKKAKAPDGWLDLNLFCSTHGGGGTNIYNSDGTLTGNRTLDASGYNLSFNNITNLKFNNTNFDGGYYQDYQIIKLGDYQNNIWSGTYFEVDQSNFIIKTSHNNNDIGLKLDFANTLYQFGQINGGNQTYINIDDQFPTIRTYIGNINNGISFEGTSTYKFGQITGGNTKTFAIDDAAGFGFQFSGTGITQATTGANSGQYLKVKVGGNDYVIELKNPS